MGIHAIDPPVRVQAPAFTRFFVLAVLVAIALLFAANALRGTTGGSDHSHDDRPVQIDR